MAKYIESGKPVSRNNFSGDTPNEVKFDSKEGPVKYNEQKLFYNYGTPEDPTIQDVLIEGPIMKSNVFKVKDNGMKTSKAGNQYHDIKYSMMLIFDLADPDPENKVATQKSLQIFQETYFGCAKALGPFKGKVGLHHFDPEHPEATIKDFVYWPRNDQGEIVKGKNPSIWADFETFGNKTIITDLNGKTIDWKLLQGSDIEILPLFHFKSNFVGTVKKIKVSLRSGIITKIIPSGSETAQTSTLDRLKAKYGSTKVDEVEAQLAELRMAKQEVVEPSPEFGERNHSQVHDMAKEEASEPRESLQDFLGGAPSMPSQPSVPKLTTLKIN